MTKGERAAFRKSKIWLETRAKARRKTNVDYITKDPLVKLWNLHHLDMCPARYANVDDLTHFIPLNPKTHDMIHLLYNIYKKDKRVLDRVKKILDKMEELTNAK